MWWTRWKSKPSGKSRRLQINFFSIKRQIARSKCLMQAQLVSRAAAAASFPWLRKPLVGHTHINKWDLGLPRWGLHKHIDNNPAHFIANSIPGLRNCRRCWLELERVFSQRKTVKNRREVWNINRSTCRLYTRQDRRGCVYVFTLGCRWGYFLELHSQFIRVRYLAGAVEKRKIYLCNPR